MTKYIPSDNDKVGPLKIAKKVSEKSRMRYQLGSVLATKKGVIIAKAPNVSLQHTFGKPPYRCLHSEIYTILKAVRKLKTNDLSDYILYVYRKNGMLAKPCKNCCNLIELFKIKKVIYSDHKVVAN